MANQQAMVLEAIMSIKKAVAREKDRNLDSDNEAPKTTNRGNKLKRRAEYWHEGELGGRMPYRRKIEHAGYSRFILKRNPKRFDEEGYELLTDEEDEEADKEAAKKNPYHGIHIDQLLMPLTHPWDLETHPALSTNYKSKVLPNMVDEIEEMVHRERKTLVDMKLLMEQLRGDTPWIPPVRLMRDDDVVLFGTELQPDSTFKALSLYPPGFNSEPKDHSEVVDDAAGTDHMPAVNGDFLGDADALPVNLSSMRATQPVEAVSGYTNGASKANGSSNTSKLAETAPDADDIAMDDAPVAVDVHPEKQNHDQAVEESRPSEKNKTNGDSPSKRNGDVTEETGGDPALPVSATSIDPNPADVPKSSNPPTPSAISSPGSSPPARMQTRAQTNAANGTPQLTALSRSTSPHLRRAASPPPLLHPLYLFPPSALPDRDIGLPAPEAEELRRLLAVYIQKQEEVCRGADRLYQGLLKALRLRDTVWRWCRAEEHRGEMSDGEDWVDLDEWGLDEELRKGDAVTEENGEEPGKKPRGRRVAG